MNLPNKSLLWFLRVFIKIGAMLFLYALNFGDFSRCPTFRRVWTQKSRALREKPNPFSVCSIADIWIEKSLAKYQNKRENDYLFLYVLLETQKDETTIFVWYHRHKIIYYMFHNWTGLMTSNSISFLWSCLIRFNVSYKL